MNYGVLRVSSCGVRTLELLLQVTTHSGLSCARLAHDPGHGVSTSNLSPITRDSHITMAAVSPLDSDIEAPPTKIGDNEGQKVSKSADCW